MRNSNLQRLFSVVYVVLQSLIIVTACNDTSTLKPTKEFYINDNAKALLNSTKWTIFAYSDELYKDSSVDEYKEKMIDGSQVVVLTLANQDGINITEIFNDWGIGKNDMGLLLVLYFDKNGDELIYNSLDVEIGVKMSEYLSAFEASIIVDEYFNNPKINATDIDLRLISLYFGFMEFIYLNVYEYSSYNYDSFINEYLNSQYEYFDLLPSERPDFFSNLPLWAWILIIVLVLLGSRTFLIPLLFLLTGKGFSISGAGGRSRGYRFRK